jgi:pyruvate-formate lyase
MATQEESDGITLREHVMALLAEMDRRFEAAIAAQDKAVQIAMIASEKAVVKAEIAAEKRFESVNEFRGQLADQAATFMPRAEAEQRMNALGEKIVDLTGSSRAGASTLWGYLVGAVGVVIAVITLFVR